MVIGGPPEFKTRTDGLVGLKNNDALTSKSFAPGPRQLLDRGRLLAQAGGLG